jgi:hypothetical protein
MSVGEAIDPRTGIVDAQGRLLESMGKYLTGLGLYTEAAGGFLVSEAEANAKRFETWKKLNEYLYQIRLEMERRRRARREARRAVRRRLLEAKRIELERLAAFPKDDDVQEGRALDALVALYVEGANRGRALDAFGDDPLPEVDLAEIPFEFGRGPIATLLPALNATDFWPPLLRGSPFTVERRLYEARSSVLMALDRGHMAKPEDIESVLDRTRALYSKLRSLSSDPGYEEARNFLIGLHEVARTIRTGFDPRTTLVSEYRAFTNDMQASVAEFLEFVDIYDLRFGEARTWRVIRFYKNLHHILSSKKPGILLN